MATPTIAMIPSGYKANKVYSVLPTNGDADLTFARTSTRTRINSDGLVEDLAIGVPALDYTDGGCPVLSLEPSSTNLYLNSDTLVTQDVTTTANDYTVSFYGTGTITFTGTYSGSLVGTGANDRVSLTFTATAGTLTSTVSGTVEKGQIEALGYATSYIPTSGATATRVAETLSKTGLSSYIGQTEGVFYAEIIKDVDTFSANRTISLNDGSSSNSIIVGFNANANSYIAFRVNSSTVMINPSFSTIVGESYKIAIKYKSGDSAIWINGVEVTTDTDTFTFSSPISQFDSNFGGGLFPFYGGVKDLRVFDTMLTDAELITLTTP